MFNRISQAEHDKKVGEINAAHASRYTTLATLVAHKAGQDAEGNALPPNPDEVVAAVQARLEGTTEATAEIAQLNADVDQAQALATQFKAQAEAAEATITKLTAMFGDKAKDKNFDLVKAVGDITPASFNRQVADENRTPKVAEAVCTEFDVLADKYAAGELTYAQFQKACREVKPK